MAVPNRKPNDDDDLPLDDPRWRSFTMTHHNRSEQLIGKRFSSQASNHLMDALQRGKLRCMRESRKIPIERKRVPASFWEGLEIDANPELGIIQIRHVRGAPRDLGDLYGWAYYVWEPDIDIIWGTGATAATEAAGAAQPAQPERSEPEQLPQRIIKPRRGGSRLSLTPDEIEQGKAHCRSMLDENPAWIDQVGIEGAALAVITEVLKRLEVKNWQTVKRNIIWPVMEERGLR